MRGSIQKKNGRYYLVYTLGMRRSPKTGKMVPRQKWERTPEP